MGVITASIGLLKSWRVMPMLKTSAAMNAKFSAWTQSRPVPSMGTNSGAPVLAFQEWHHFKEAYTPEIVARAIMESPIPVHRCLDPFGGSGTTAMACQFLGVEPITIEVNPYLADLIEAKLSSYDADDVSRDLGRVLRSAIRRREHAILKLPDAAPATLVEPGIGDRWIFDAEIAQRIGALLDAIQDLDNELHGTLFRVLLGGILLEVSNVVVNGKGRRYRRCWKERRREANGVEQMFGESVRRAITDIHRFGNRAYLGSSVIRGDARRLLTEVPVCDLAVFSPPYPNSFDYTDVYNLELWVLGYLLDGVANRMLRQSTLCSHVQIKRQYPAPPSGSHILNGVLGALKEAGDKLWNKRLPDMVGGYFADLTQVLSGVRAVLNERGSVWIVVGDSRYADIVIPTAEILMELASSAGFRTLSVEPFRSMRCSAQQGGKRELAESLVVLTPTTKHQGLQRPSPASNSRRDTSVGLRPARSPRVS
jgi:DNA modification methylase